jgi:hypothetical protein
MCICTRLTCAEEVEALANNRSRPSIAMNVRSRSLRLIFISSSIGLCTKSGLGCESAPEEHDVYSCEGFIVVRSSGAQCALASSIYIPLLPERNTLGFRAINILLLRSKPQQQRKMTFRAKLSYRHFLITICAPPVCTRYTLRHASW